MKSAHESELTPRRMAPLPDHTRTLSAVIAYNEHGGYCVPRSSLHRPACRAILRGEVYEPGTLDYMCRHARGDIVHAGTFFGDFLPALSRAVGEGTIWAFEPVRESFRCAEITAGLNGLQNVRLANSALGAGEDDLLFATVDATGKPLGGGSHVAAEGNERVAQIPLDRVVPADRHIAILQLDVEGYEAEALSGASELLRRNRPLVILETPPAGFADAFGYELECRLHGNSVFRPR